MTEKQAAPIGQSLSSPYQPDDFLALSALQLHNRTRAAVYAEPLR